MSPSATGNEEKEIYLCDIHSLLVKIQKDDNSMKRYREDTEIQDLKRFCDYLVCYDIVIAVALDDHSLYREG